MAIHVMLDLETLGVDPESVILTLGAVKFDPYTAKEPFDQLYIKLDVDEQVSMGREVNNDTVEWWSRQDEQAQAEAFDMNGRISVAEALKQLNRFVVGVDKIWAQGVVFDIGMIENLYRMAKTPVPWNFWQVRDSRTVLDMVNYDVRESLKQTGLHNSLQDSIFQAKAVQRVFSDLGVEN